MQNGRFPFKIALRLKKVCRKVSLCDNCQQQSCKIFIDLTIRAKNIGGGRPLLLDVLGQTDRVWAKSPIFDLHRVGKKVPLYFLPNLLRWSWMTLSGVIALILRFFAEFDSFTGQLRHSGWRQMYNVRKILSPDCSYSLPQ